ncbi:hypothetical protein CYMTET_35169 [Cymbomonas tetramitiformis]|uniref:Uncharacterized protein n=1 Tax=Cymbomonas tetramitiformis TaxID=36881 RepID=A0AAE0KP83_9CHLO|nr:hypothetical protein CYMTET_35169 [Cymbomonas tetramitiformis]
MACGEYQFVIPPILSKLGHARAQGLLLHCCTHPRRGLWLRGVPPGMTREAAEERARRMQEALRVLLLVGAGVVGRDLEEVRARRMQEALRVLLPVGAGVVGIGICSVC